MNTYRLLTINGLVFDFQSPNSLEGMWVMICGEGFFRVFANSVEVERIPWHAVGSLKMVSGEGQAAQLYGTPAQGAA